MKHAIFSLFLLAAAQLCHAQQPAALSPGSRILLHGRAATAGVARHLGAAGQTARAFVAFDPAAMDWQALEALGVTTGARTASAVTATIPLDRLEAVARVRGVRYVQTGSAVAQQLDKARAETGADNTRNGAGLDRAYTGKGVVVGVVDKGFDYTHKAFYDAGGRLRISRVWEQTTKASERFQAPQPFGYGAELRTQADLEWAIGDIAGNSHGTHVANIAAGGGLLAGGSYQGVAPDAEIVLVSMDANSADNVAIADAVAYIFAYADSVGKPCVVNLSLGTQTGPHDGTSLFDTMADAMQGPGRLIVGSAGNHRTDKFHLARQFAGAEDSALRTFINYYSGPSVSNRGGELDIWGTPGMEFEVRVMAYNTFSKVAKATATVYPSDEPTQAVRFSGYMTDSLVAASEVSPLNGKPHVRIASAVSGLRKNYALAIEIVPKTAGQVDIWADNTFLGLSDKGVEGFAQPTTETTIAELGGTGRRIVSVGAYTTRSDYTLYGETTPTATGETLGAIWSHSSNGPTADGRMKPEVAAPGCMIVSALSANDNSGTTLVAASIAGDSRNYQYGYMQGTSMSAPFVTGTAATWLQACPDLSPEQLREVLAATARLDSHTGDARQAEALGFGYGKVDVWAGAKACAQLAASGIRGVADPGDGWALGTGGRLRLAFTAATARAEVTLRTLDGRTVSRQLLGNIAAGTEVEPAGSRALHGVYVLSVKTERGSGSRKVAF